MGNLTDLKLSITANDAFALYQTLHSLNQIIEGLWTISDARYYLSYAFNGGSCSDEEINNIFTEEEIGNIASKFEHIRAIVISEMLMEYSNNFEQFELAVLKSSWEQEYESGNKKDISKSSDKRRVKEYFATACREKEALKEFYKKIYGEDIEK